MNSNEAKTNLLLYRPGTADADDPEVAESLRIAQHDPQLTGWLEEHCARQEVLRSKFRKIAPPEGLREQILSEHAAFSNITVRRRSVVVAMAAAFAVLIGLVLLWIQPHAENKFTNYRTRMVSTALRGYTMNLETNDLAQIHAFLAQQRSLSDYVLPAALQKVAATGCATLTWQSAKVAMVCFHTGKPLPPGENSDLWLFVIPRASVTDAPPVGSLQFAKVNKLITASWTQGDKVYLLGTEGDEQTVKRFL